jgi:hypothetical protein
MEAVPLPLRSQIADAQNIVERVMSAAHHPITK